MPDINPALPIIGQPDATEDPKVVTALTQLIAAVNDVDSAQIADGSIAISDLAAGLLRQSGAVVTALPTSPVDGEECFYLADDTAGIVWHLKYRADSASDYKWEYIGGHALRFLGASQVFATSAELAGWTNRAGGSLVAPLAGDYRAHFGSRIGVSGGGLGQSGYIGVANGDTSPGAGAQAAHGEEQHTFVGGTSWASVVGTTDLEDLNADDVIKLRYTMGGTLSGSGASVSWQANWLEITPIRVG